MEEITLSNFSIILQVKKEELYVETSILENEPTFNFDIFAADSRNKK